MLRKVLLGMALFAGIIAPVTASHAASTIVVEMGEGAFFPFRVQAAQGDTIRFVNKGPAHQIASYSGQAFDSGPQPIPPYGVFDIVYDGSETAYRETGRRSNGTTYSTLDGLSCSGMCGWITTSAPAFPPAAPVVVSPAANATLTTNTVTIVGTVTNANRVRITHAASNKVVDVLANGSEGNFSWTWSFPNGPVLLSLRGWDDQEGWAGPTVTHSVTINGGDVEPPTIALDPTGRIGLINQPTPARIGQIEVGTGAINVSAIVRDDVQVASVTAKVTDLVTNGETQVALECTNFKGETFLGGCAATTGQYVRAVAKSFVRPGYYRVSVTAKDGVGNQTTKYSEVILVSPV